MNLSRTARFGIGLAAIAWLGSCSDHPVQACSTCPPPPSVWPGVVSDPVTAGVPASSGAASALGSVSGADVVYISLVPGTTPGGEVASIRNRVTGSSVVAAMVGGGLDPVPVSANAGDTLDIDVRLVGSDSTLHFVHAVAAARRPIVVRTDPPPRKRDVPLNAVMLVVFSEPIDPATLTGAAVQLLQGTTPVAGQLEFRDPANLTAAFVPAAPLAASTDYRLIVTQGIRDLDGEALEGPVTVEFTTASGLMPGASRIAFVRDVDPSTSNTANDLYLMNADGSDVTRLTFGGQAHAPAWSPDGRSIAFLSWDDSTDARQIYVMEAAPGGLASRLTDELSGANVTDPAWSPDGTRIAFVKTAERECDGTGFCYTPYRVFVTGTTFGAAITQLSSEPPMPDSVVVYHYHPEWSPDGSKIAFTREVGRRDSWGNVIPDSALSGIYVMNSDGTGTMRLAAGDWPAWSPDGTRIAFAVLPGLHLWPSSVDCLQTDIHVVNADGSGLTRLTTGAQVLLWARLAWSPDGTQIAFPSMRDGVSDECDSPYDSDVYIMNADGSGMARLTHTGLDHSPAWSRR